MGKPRDLWLSVEQWDRMVPRVLAIGPWPSKARRAIAAASWHREPRTRSVRTSAGRPRGADQYITPRLTKAERNALERRRGREEQPRG